MAGTRVLVIDDEKALCDLFTDILSRDAMRVDCAHSGKGGLEFLAANDDIALVFVDMKLPDRKGTDVLRDIKRERPALPVVVMTGFASKETAVEAMRLGAYDYLAKPFNIADVSLIARRALERNRLIDDNTYLRDQLRQKYKFDNIVGTSPKAQAAYILAAKVATQNATVLITGESGTGKEMLARAIHYQSNRADRPFVKVNCAALPEHLLEDELFGHEKGAFTDAVSQRIGRFEYAHTGTIFLDEIGEVSLPVQVKLLRVLQEREFERIGSSKTIKVDVRILAATNRDLPLAIENGTFPEDLYYRLNVVPIELPPLRERREDIAHLVGFFVSKYSDETGRKMRVSDEAMEVLKNSYWRGNIRELENCIERAVILAEDDLIEPRHLLLAPSPSSAASTSGGLFGGEIPTLREAEQQLIRRALEKTNGDESAAAKMLGVTPAQLKKKRAEA